MEQKKYKYEKYDYSKVDICKPKWSSCVWTVQLSDNINTYTNIAAERELTAALSTNIAQEIDRNILEYLTGTYTTATGPYYTPTYITNREDFSNVYSYGQV